MAKITRILRKRRSGRKNPSASLGKISVAIFSIVLFITLSVGFLFALAYAQIFNDLPSTEKLREVYGESLDQFPQVTEVYDRTGERRLFQLLHPAAQARKWVHLEPAVSERHAPDVVKALIATQDPDYWSAEGFDIGDLIGDVSNSGEWLRGSIPQRLAEIALLPAEDLLRHPISRRLRSGALAQALVRDYSKRQILELYLNSVHFGNLAQGIDAAALQYFGVHAEDLNLGQSAMLVAIAENTNLNLQSETELKTAQGLVLAELERFGAISGTIFRTALAEPISIETDGMWGLAGVMNSIAQELEITLGLGTIHHPGLQIQSSIDAGLQEQMECTILAYLRSEDGEPIRTGECEPTPVSFPVEPPEILLNDLSALVVDPVRGEVLGLYGDIFQNRSPGVTIDPFVYLTAFSRGHAPGSMILDLAASNEGDRVSLGSEAHGPVRMRRALLGGYSHAFRRVVEMVGQGAVEEILSQMGLGTPQAAIDARLDPQVTGGSSPLESAFAYGVIANSGVMAGRASIAGLNPILIREVRGRSGGEVYRVEEQRRSILSASLAYLLIDVLSDSTNRVELFGGDNLLELDHPIALMADRNPEGERNLSSIGFTPSRVVGLWGGGATSADPLNGEGVGDSIDLWIALMRVALQDVPVSDWEIPEGIRFVEVCDPSGQLPTEDCPDRVTEVYLSGSEPTQRDQLYRSLWVNRETGKLATVYTPLALVEEKTFFIPPIEALPWAEANHIPLAPVEFDPVGDLTKSTEAWIDTPALFAHVHGEVGIRGGMNLSTVRGYRLEVGSGLYPDRWYLVEESGNPLRRGLLGRWDSSDFDGVMTLRLLGIDGEGRVVTAYRPVTVDNQEPIVHEIRAMTKNTQLLVFVSALDNLGIARAELFVDGNLVTSLDTPPFIFILDWTEDERAEVFVRIYDQAGNRAESKVLIVGEG